MERNLLQDTKPPSKQNKNLKFVVVGCGHSATRYMSRFFTQLNIPCGHEDIFSRDGILENETLVGDASWRAMPHLKDFKGVIFHQVRHPIPVLSSFIWLGKNRGLDEWKPYVDVDCPVEVGAMRVYSRWNQMCEQGNPYFRYQIEDITAELMFSFCFVIGMPRSFDDIQLLIEKMPRKINFHYKHKVISWDDLPDCDEKQELYKTAKRYGYNSEIFEEKEKRKYKWKHTCNHIHLDEYPPDHCPKCDSNDKWTVVDWFNQYQSN